MIGILFISDIRICPYKERYIENLEKNNVDYQILYWNRSNEIIESSSKNRVFNSYSNFNKSKYSKLLDFIKFRRWLKKEIKLNNYEKLIILSTLTGIIIFDKLLFSYKKKYVFDIRDYSYEHNKLFFYIQKKLILNSDFTCISSEGFKEFLPKVEKEYVLSHNFIYRDVQNAENETKYIKKREKINLVWIGWMRYFDHQKKIIDKLKNDERFNLYYHGDGPELDKYKNYVIENNINNVFFTGAYSNENKSILLNNCDILNNSYLSEKNMEVKYAISNKYYDGIIYRIPQLVEHETYKANLVDKNGVGISLNVNNDSFADELYKYYLEIDSTIFSTNCDLLQKKYLNDDLKYLKKIENFFR